MGSPQPGVEKVGLSFGSSESVPQVSMFLLTKCITTASAVQCKGRHVLATPGWELRSSSEAKGSHQDMTHQADLHETLLPQT